MAIFEGTIQEFHNHIGPRIRNIINSYAKKERMARNGICEICGESDRILESAHIHGRDRRSIIESILKDYVSGNIVRCDILKAEKSILAAHEPIADTFKFLCRPCHFEYDRLTSSKDLSAKTGPDVISSHKLSVSFLPSDESLFKRNLIKNKQAYVVLFMNDGSTKSETWVANKFSETSNLRGNIFSGYLRNWEKKGIKKALFSIEKTDSFS